LNAIDQMPSLKRALNVDIEEEEDSDNEGSRLIGILEQVVVLPQQREYNQLVHYINYFY